MRSGHNSAARAGRTSAVLLALLCGAAAHAQRTGERPPPVTKGAPAQTQPASKLKTAPVDASALDAPLEVARRAFVRAVGREGSPAELQAATSVVVNGATRRCKILTPGESKNYPRPDYVDGGFDCVTPIKAWLHASPQGQAVYLHAFDKAVRDAYGVVFQGGYTKPPTDGKDMFTPHPGYDDLVEDFSYCIYHTSSKQCGASSLYDQIKKTALKNHGIGSSGGGNKLAEEDLTLKATMNRAFLRAFTRTMTEKDRQTFEPVFRQEGASYRRMVEILQNLDSLKNIKP